MTEIGSVSQSFNVLNKDMYKSKTSAQQVSFEENFGEVFSKIAAKNMAQAVVQKSNISSPELNSYVPVALKPKNKKWQELEEDTLKDMLKKVRRLAVEWVKERKEGRK